MTTDNTQAPPDELDQLVEEYEAKQTDVTLATMMRADLDVQISTAKAYPRSIKRFVDKALSLATVSVEVADKCNYAVPRGDKVIQGPSVRLAEIIFSTYGNLRVGARVVMNDGRWVTAQGICHDLESNVSMTIEVKRSIMQNEYEFKEVDGKRKRVRTGRMIQMNDDMQTLVGNVACSIAYRNAIFKVVPKASWSSVYEAALLVAKGDATTLVTRRDAALKYFHDLKVTDEQICMRLDVERVEDIDLEKLVLLRGFASAIKNQEASMEGIFPPIKPPTEPKGTAATKAAEAKLAGKGGRKPPAAPKPAEPKVPDAEPPVTPQ